MDSRDTLLLACGTSANRQVLRNIFEDSFNLLEANNIQQAKLFLEQNHACIAAILLDISVASKVSSVTPKEICKAAAQREIPVVIITDDNSPMARVTLFEQGATDVYSLGFEPYILQHRVHNIVDLYRHKWHLEKLVNEQAEILQHSNDTMVDTLSSIIEHRSAESGQHNLRIRRFTQILLEEIAKTCPEYGLTEENIRIISSASALHDIGKISIPDSVLNKPGKLTRSECEIMKSHSVTGCNILESLRDVVNADYYRYAHNICHYHHERWDGKGYPEGLVGDAIPICAQVVGLVDAYDALTNKRVYKEAFPFEQAVNMILNGECGAFSPQLLECFKQVAERFEDLARFYADGNSPTDENFDVTLPPPSPQDNPNSLQTVQAKYLSMLHYINATVVEVDLEQGIYHMVYNPDPNLTLLSPSVSYQEVCKILLEHLLIPEDHEKFLEMTSIGIPNFLQTGQLQQRYLFHFRNHRTKQPEPYMVTLLRLDRNNLEKQRFFIIYEKENIKAASFPTTASPAMESLAESCVFLNDTYLTLSQGHTCLSVLTGYSADELETLFCNQLIRLAAPQDRDMIRQRFNEQLTYGADVQLTYQLQHKGGHMVWILHKGHLALNQDGQMCLQSILLDITRAKNAQTAYNMTLEQYQLILSQTGNIVFEWNLQTDSILFSNTWEEIFGYAPLRTNIRSDLLTRSHCHPDDIPLLFDWVNTLKHGSTPLLEIRIANSEGRYLWCRFRATTTFDADGNAARILGTIVNITAEKEAAYALQQKAQSDSLTKLINKETARSMTEEFLSSSGEVRCALLIIDLDNFKQVNDQFGHLFGDAILVHAAREIKKLFRSQDMVARIGGDEFMVLMKGTNDTTLIKNRCEQLISLFEEITNTQLNNCILGCSIGISLCPANGVTYHDLFQRADQALYQAKNFGKNQYIFYDGSDPAYHTPRQAATALNARIDSEEHPNLSADNIVQYAFQRLYGSGDTESAINSILELIGQQMNVSRVYVFENTPDNKYCNNTYEWCNVGIPPEKDNLQNVSYETDIPEYEKNFDENGIFYCPDVSELPLNLREILEPQGIISLLHCAIRDNGVFRGYIGFDECSTKRLWTKEQIQTLTFFSELLGVFLLKQQAQKAMSLKLDNLNTILDNQNNWIYVIDPDTHQLQFLNAKLKATSAHTEEGHICYKTLRGLDAPCPGCPAQDIREKKNAEQIIPNPKEGVDALCEATLIRWDGKDACLMSCQEIKAME